MNLRKTFFLILSLAVFSLSSGCGAANNKSNSGNVIESAKRITGKEAKINYLISEGEKFIASEQFQDAINTAEYILSNLDKGNPQAKDLINRAKESLAKNVEGTVQKMQGAFDYGR